MRDELEDVILEGRRLVSDNPADWHVPDSARAYDSVFDWWVNLQRSDQVHPATMGLFTDLVDTHLTCHDTVRTTRIRQLTELLLERGLTLDQITDAMQLQSGDLLGRRHEYAWRLTVDGADADTVAREANIPPVDARRFARIAARESTRRQMKSEQLVEEAFELIDSGLSHRQVAERLSEVYGMPLKQKTVGAWVSRYRLRARREAS